VRAREFGELPRDEAGGVDRARARRERQHGEHGEAERVELRQVISGTVDAFR